MQGDAKQAAARILADLRVRANGQVAPLDNLPERCRPRTLDDAYAVQALIRPLLAERGLGPSAGWKVGCTTPVMQAYLDIPHPCAGTLYQASLYRSGVTLAASDYFKLGLECEIAVRMARDYAPPAGGAPDGDIAAAVDAVMTSVEIVDHRFRDFTRVRPPCLVADDFFSAGCVVGEERSLRDVGDLAALSGGFLVDGNAGEQGTGAAILGHPLNALRWLAEHLSAQGAGLKAGEIVTLGSVVKTIYPTAGTRIEARFDRLPPVLLQIA